MNRTRTIILSALIGLLSLTGCASAPGLAPMSRAEPCTGHCETHSEGYQWAQRNNLSDAGVCKNYPKDFASGCRDGVEDMLQIRPYSQGI